MVDYDSIITSIYKGIDELYLETSDYYQIWARSVARRELSRTNNGLSQKEKTCYELRIELKGTNFNIYWYEINFVRTGNKTIRLSKLISLPRNGFYEKKNFKNASEWELKLILDAEEHLGRVRNQLKHLNKAHTSILYASKNSARPIKSIPIKKRVNPIVHNVQYFKKQFS